VSSRFSDTDMTKKKIPARRSYTPEFKADAVRLATAPGANIAQTARDLGIGDTLLRNWIRAVREQAAGGLSSDERAELARLRRENRQLKEEREILKKATAFFAKEQR
jgi:transposase